MEGDNDIVATARRRRNMPAPIEGEYEGLCLSVWEDGSLKVISDSGDTVVPVSISTSERREILKFKASVLAVGP